MKKFIVLLLVALMMFSTTAMVFAEETTTEVTEERPERTNEEKRAAVTELYVTYFAEGLDAFNEVIEAHKSFHESTRTERELFKADVLAAREAFKESVKAGDMTREEAKVILEEAKAENVAVKADVEAIKLLKQADVEANKAEMTIARESLRAALESEVVDNALVASILNQMTGLMNNHLELDYLYYDMIHDLFDAQDDII